MSLIKNYVELMRWKTFFIDRLCRSDIFDLESIKRFFDYNNIVIEKYLSISDQDKTIKFDYDYIQYEISFTLQGNECLVNFHKTVNYNSNGKFVMTFNSDPNQGNGIMKKIKTKIENVNGSPDDIKDEKLVFRLTSKIKDNDIDLDYKYNPEIKQNIQQYHKVDRYMLNRNCKPLLSLYEFQQKYFKYIYGNEASKLDTRLKISTLINSDVDIEKSNALIKDFTKEVCDGKQELFDEKVKKSIHKIEELLSKYYHKYLLDHVTEYWENYKLHINNHSIEIDNPEHPDYNKYLTNLILVNKISFDKLTTTHEDLINFGTTLYEDLKYKKILSSYCGILKRLNDILKTDFSYENTFNYIKENIHMSYFLID
jgi:hypothetical protein